VELTVVEAPLPGVLRVCSRLKEEYLESSVYTGLAATIKTRWCNVRNSGPGPAAHALNRRDCSLMCARLENVSNTEVTKPLIRRTKHLLLVLEGYHSSGVMYLLSLLSVKQAVRNSALSCETIRVAVLFDHVKIDRSRPRSERDFLLADIPRSTIFRAAPMTFGGLKIAQCCSGHRLSLYDITKFTAASDEFEEYWQANTIHLLAYAKDGKGDKNIMWTPEQAIAILPQVNFDFLLNRFNEGQDWLTEERMTKEYGEISKVIVGWQEKDVTS
jgi:hypothetical protein